MDSLTIIDKREQLRSKLNDMLDIAEKEQRKLTDDETKEFEALNTEIRELENKINDIKTETKEVRKMGKFSLLKAINDIANNRQLDERALEVVNQGITEMRKAGQNYSGQIQLPLEERAVVQATVEGQGAETVAEDLLNILEPLRAKLVLA
jgi:HK97 family phage major capsid protein